MSCLSGWYWVLISPVAQAVSGNINSVFRFLCASVFVDATLFTVNIYNKSVTSAQLYVAVRMLPLSLINLIRILRLLHQFVWVEIEPEVDIR